MLEINNYNSTLLKNISFSLHKNENLLILGENGAGKSTLAKVLCYLISSNNVKLFGEDLATLSSLKRASLINYIPPKLDIFDEYITLREFFALSFIDESNEKKIDEIIKLLSLEHLENKSCLHFSSGEKQLLLLGSALLLNAKLTIFDDLSAILDINRLKEVFNVFKSNALEQKIIITHNLDLAYALKYKILYLKEGEIVFFGEHEEFFSSANLEKFYKNILIKIQNHLVVNL